MQYVHDMYVRQIGNAAKQIIQETTRHVNRSPKDEQGDGIDENGQNMELLASRATMGLGDDVMM